MNTPNVDLLSYCGYRFPATVISHCVWLYFRFSLNYRDVEEMMAERGVVVSYERDHRNTRRSVVERAQGSDLTTAHQLRGAGGGWFLHDSLQPETLSLGRSVGSNTTHRTIVRQAPFPG